MLADTLQQGFPLLYEGMWLLFKQKAHLVGNDSTIAHHDVRQILEGICHLTSPVNHPRLFRFTQEVFQTLADDSPSDVEHKVGHIAFIVADECYSLVVIEIQWLTCHQHRATRLHEHTADVAQYMRRNVGRRQADCPLRGQVLRREVKQWLADRNIDVDRSVVYDEGLIDEAVAIPACLVIMGFWQ